jgi:hypothetical protein
MLHYHPYARKPSGTSTNHRIIVQSVLPVDGSSIGAQEEDSQKQIQMKAIEPVEFSGEHGATVKRLVEDYTKFKEELKKIPGLDLPFYAGRPPHISKKFIQTEEYKKTLDKLTEKFGKAEFEFKALTGLYPNESPDFAKVFFDDKDAENSVSPEIFDAAYDVNTTWRDLNAFLQQNVSVDLVALRLKVLGLWTGLTGAMHELRSLQNQGVDIGTIVFPFHPGNAAYSPML